MASHRAVAPLEGANEIVSAFVADARDPGIRTVLRWLGEEGHPGDELLLLGADAIEATDLEVQAAHQTGIAVIPVTDESWLPGANCAIRGVGTQSLLDVASRSALEVFTCGERGTFPPPESADDAFDRIVALPGDLDHAEARFLYRLAQVSPPEPVIFDLGGQTATVIATARLLEGLPPPVVVVEDRQDTAADELRAALEANLGATGTLEVVRLEEDLDEALAGNPPVGLVVLPRSLDYMGAHALAQAFGPRLGDETLMVRPSPASEPTGAGLAFSEMVDAGLVPPFQGSVGALDVFARVLPEGIELDPVEPSAPRAALRGGTTRKAEPESEDSKHYLSGRHIDAFMAKHAPKLAGRVIDHGCGNKPFESLLINCTALVGVDIQQSSDHRVDVLISPREELPFPSGWFDNGVCTEVLEHCEDPGEVLCELGRVIRAGGHLLVSTPFVWPLHEEPRDFFRFSPHALRYLLDAAGFEIVDQTASGGLWEVIHQLQAALLDGSTDTARRRIRRLNLEGVARDAWDPHSEISLHYPTLARRSGSTRP